MKMPELPPISEKFFPEWDDRSIYENQFNVEDMEAYAKAYGELVRKACAEAVWEASGDNFRKFGWVYAEAKKAIEGDT